MSLPGSNATVTIEHLTQAPGPHGGKIPGQPDQTFTEEAVIDRPSAQVSTLWKVVVAGDYSQIAKGPAEWRLTDDRGRIYTPTRATYRPPIDRIGESEHTLLFAEQVGEVDVRQEV
ncbi:MAG TPA: hypothetical protein VFK14_11555 [Solirubrobacterales bacterium]|nr:hypothetical protein [Solirubrobacterales bacterium]